VLLERLRLYDYRNLAEEELSFGPRFNVLHGHNGAGKTNVLEAVYLIATLRSFRTSQRATLIRHEQPVARVELSAHDDELEAPTRLSVRLERSGNGAVRRAELDGKTVGSATEFYGLLQAVLFTPEDLNVLRGAPIERRQLMDRAVFARERAHITDTRAYDKLVRSRNRVLRQHPGARDDVHQAELLETYEDGLATIGARLWTRRVKLLEQLAKPFAARFERINGAASSARLRYASRLGDVPDEARQEALRTELGQRRRDDELRGMTSVGPHRDDLVVELDGAPAAQFASQGQSRSLLLAFKLAELEVAREARRRPPLLLLDDVSSELDEVRSAQLFEALAEEVGQCVLTTTSLKFVTLPDAIARSVFVVDDGTVREMAAKD
jgi:DNA replication and repair protein RecF